MGVVGIGWWIGVKNGLILPLGGGWLEGFKGRCDFKEGSI